MWVLTSLRLLTASILGCCCPKKEWWIRDSHFGRVEAVFGPMEERLFCDLDSGQRGEKREGELWFPISLPSGCVSVGFRSRLGTIAHKSDCKQVHNDVLCNLRAGPGLSLVSAVVSLPLLPLDYLVGAFIHGYLDFLVKSPAHALCIAGPYPCLVFFALGNSFTLFPLFLVVRRE